MQRLIRLQIFGPVALLVAVLAAETAAYALAVEPSSAFLWYLNLEVFSLFRKSRATISEYCNLPFAQVILVAGPLALLGFAGLVLKRELLLAISSNLSFVFAGFLAYSWVSWNSLGNIRAASLTAVHVQSGSTLCLFAALLLASFISFAASHFLYFRTVRTEA